MKKQFLTAILGLCILAGAVRGADNLAKSFVRPPDSARPWVYWFWLNGNITREGITADLEAMKRVGIGGVLIMEVDQGAPLGPAAFMSLPWRELFKHAVAEAKRLGLEVNMNDDAGWNGSGGPWIKPEQSMQKVVWTETNLTGPSRKGMSVSKKPSMACPAPRSARATCGPSSRRSSTAANLAFKCRAWPRAMIRPTEL